VKADKSDDAAADMKYLLDRGYHKSAAMNYVADHYRLNSGERNRLVRYVFSEKEIRDHRDKLMPIRKISGEDVVVDGYNILITSQAILAGKEIVEGMDGLVRDTSATFSKYRFDENCREAAAAVLKILAECKPASVLFIFDSQMSRSGELAGYLRHEMKKVALPGDAKTKKDADRAIKRLKRITLTSDSAIIGKVGRVADLPRELLTRRRRFKSRQS